MRNITNINENWQFSKDGKDFAPVQLPHTWNNLDGQNGGANYLRQKCYYKKTLTLSPSDKKVFLEFQGVNHIANVSFNGKELGEHRGGFSTFRFDLTPHIKEGENLLEVSADNSEGLPVYPQQADFTFFGGIYRDVSIIEVGETHFDLEHYGAAGVYVTPTTLGGDADVSVLSYVKGDVDGAEVQAVIFDGEGKEIVKTTNPAQGEMTQKLVIPDPILWAGRSEGKSHGYMYRLDIQIIKNDKVLDSQTIDFGVRAFAIDHEKGFVLNGDNYSLHGVSRHQCRQDKGWALSKEDQVEDMAIINEVGANTIRLAHYQHNQFFYDLCDKEGQVIWAEIPLITVFMEEEEAIQNTKTQMKELVLQNYNHPSICFWGISNEVTLAGETETLEKCQKELVELVQSLDKTRVTTLANISFVEMDSNQNFLTDVVGYNHYFGWYGGKLTDNEKWIDTFHEKYPNRPLAITEYGAEGILTLHSENPVCRDYTEEYHAVYHEHMLEIFQSRPFLWGTYQWNMFDFAADSRDEGGVAGRNNKGLVTFDRSTKKDAFFLYKAYWNEVDPFVHLCGRRFVDRPTETTTLKVYSNQSEVTLMVNGTEIATQKGTRVFVFPDVALNKGENTVKVTAKTESGTLLTDEITLQRVDEPNPSYVVPVSADDDGGEGARNWFLSLQEELGAVDEMTFDSAFFSLKDTLEEVMAHPEAGEVLRGMLGKGGTFNEGMMKMLGKIKLEKIVDMAAEKFPEGVPALLNAKLQKIKK